MEILHFAKLVSAQAKMFGDAPAMRYRDYTDGTWRPISWNEFNRDVDRTAKALIEFSVFEKDRIGLYTQNKPEGLVIEFALYSNRAICVPMYATSTTAQIEYIINDAGIHILFVGDQYQYDRAFEAIKSCPSLNHIIIIDTNVRLAITDVTSIYFKDFLQTGVLSKKDQGLSDRRNRAEAADLANILYTSGTTGEPKGVLLTHAMYLEAMRVNKIKLNMASRDDVSMSFLPMNHIFEKAWNCFCLSNGIRIDINLRPADIQMTLKEVRPTCICSVPRFWEKIYHGIQEKINSYPGFIRHLFNRGVRVGKIYNLDYKRKGLRPPFWNRISYFIYAHTIFRTIKKTVGLENGKIFPVAGAKLSDDLCLFFRSIGFPIYYGYGLTESTATVSAFDEKNYHVGTVGSIIDGLQVRISPEGEILLKGKTITPGYYKKPEATAAAFTEDGFFRTGDAGTIDTFGHLVITDRIKDLYKTSNGKYIAPQLIETALSEDAYIDMVAVIGDEHKYVTALIVPALSEIPALGKSLGIESTDLQKILEDERMYAFFEKRIRNRQKNMAGFEQIRRFSLLPAPFTMERGELTNTLKLRRKTIAEHYADIINAMY
ncbi:MAG: long-chain fatty acid--CoA ligase [Bacteroidales bacterium]|nr:long-chain fatty acid--CoA ligase [Bacteroidales bacterium]